MKHLILLAAAFFTAALSAATYYVDTENGDDGWDGLSEATAVKTFAKAADLAKSATKTNPNTIIALPGVYDEGVSND